MAIQLDVYQILYGGITAPVFPIFHWCPLYPNKKLAAMRTMRVKGPSGPGGLGRGIIFVGHDFEEDTLNLESYVSDVEITSCRVLGVVGTIHVIRRSPGPKEAIGEALRDLVRHYLGELERKQQRRGFPVLMYWLLQP